MPRNVSQRLMVAPKKSVNRPVTNESPSLFTAVIDGSQVWGAWSGCECTTYLIWCWNVVRLPSLHVSLPWLLDHNSANNWLLLINTLSCREELLLLCGFYRCALCWFIRASQNIGSVCSVFCVSVYPLCTSYMICISWSRASVSLMLGPRISLQSLSTVYRMSWTRCETCETCGVFRNPPNTCS